ncbi:hypothetical protein GCM10027267_03970 [Paramicrobacterium agarici]
MGARESDHGHRIFNPVLSVGIEGNDKASVRLLQDVFEAGLQRSSLAKIYRVLQDFRTCTPSGLSRSVRASIVDADHIGELSV